MLQRRIAHLPRVLVLLLVLAPALSLAEPAPSGQPGTAGTGGSAAVPPEISKPITLTESQMTGFLDAMDDLHALGEANKGGARNPSQPAAFVRGLKLSEESQAILKKHGFASTTEFQQVAYNAAAAYGVLKQGGKEETRKKMDKAKSQQAQAMEQMKQHLSPEQLKMLSAQMDSAMGIADSMQDVPDSNLELVKKYRDRMDALSRQR